MSDLNAPPASSAGKTSAPQKGWKRILGFRFLFLSILAHFLFGGVAAYVIVEHFQPKRKLTFAPGPAPSESQPTEHKVQIDKKNNSMSAPPDMKRITTTGLSEVTLPEMPDLPTTDADLNPSAMNGAEGNLGTTDATAATALDDAASNGFFGSTSLSEDQQHAQGDFYDFSRNASSQPQKIDGTLYSQILNEYVNGGWVIPDKYPRFTSPIKIFTKFIFVPVIPDAEAGKAFQSPKSSNAFWVVHYHATIQSDTNGNYRFIGFGDNVNIVAVNGQVVFEGSDHQYLHLNGMTRVGGNSAVYSGPGKDQGTPLFTGRWFNLDAGKPFQLDILIGDEGGVTTSGLFIELQGPHPLTFSYKDGNGGAKYITPNAPLFVIGRISSGDQHTLSAYLPPACFPDDAPKFTVSIETTPFP